MFPLRRLWSVYFLGALVPGLAFYASFRFGWPLAVLPLAVAGGATSSVFVLWRLPLTLEQRLRWALLIPVLTLLAIAVGFLTADGVHPSATVPVD
jgi:hypothetical protein